MSLSELRKKLKVLSDKEKALILQKFFKTGPGEYAEGDKFLGIVVPVQRKIASEFKDLSYDELKSLIKSEIHEERLISLIILVNRFKKASDSEREKIFKFYLKHRKGINNWDLVDLSAPSIVGGYLEDKDRSLLYKLAVSKSLWERRIAILSTFYFIRRKDFTDALKISELLLNDKEDLIHKAAGWMLREIGNRDLSAEEHFLKKHYNNMPRTMLRYAIEKFPATKRKKYLEGRI